MHLFTIGYQGTSIEPFLDTLLAHGIEQLIDVRALPFSRKPDFSKKRLAAHLERVGIGYTHMPALGTPKPLRDEVRRTKDYPTFFAAMEQLIAMQPEAIAQALLIAQAQPAALLCFEANVAECHRLSVAQAMVQAAAGSMDIIDL